MGLCAAYIVVAYLAPDVLGSALGWALGVGRIGSILGPGLGALLVGETPRLFLYAAVPLMLAATAALAASVVHKGRPT